MKVKIKGEAEITLTQAAALYSPTPDAQETDITCVADVAESLKGKYFNLYAANNSTRYYIYYDIDTSAEVTTFTTVANTTASLSGKYFKFYDTNKKSYVTWFNTGVFETNTLTCGTAAQTDMTGTKEVNTIVAEADSSASLDGQCFHFWALDANNGTDTEYYCYFDVDDGGLVGDPGESGTAIKVVVATDALDTVVGTAVRDAITASSADVTVSGSGANIILTGDYWGASTAAADGTATTGWSSFTRTATGVDITAGDYLTFESGLTGSETSYYVWFNATGGAAASTAPSTDPAVVGATGIQVDHAFDANAEAMGLALRTALTTAAPSGVTISGATTDAIIANTINGIGVAATTGSAPTGFSVARTVTGVASSTQPTGFPVGSVFVEVDLNQNDTDAEVGLACRTALGASSDVTDEFTISGSTTSVIITCDTSGPLNNAVVGDSGFSVSETTSGRTDPLTNDPKIPNATGAKVTILPDELSTAVAEKTKDVIHALSDFSATRSNSIISVVNAANGECTDASNGSGFSPGFTFSTTTSGVTGVADTASKLWKIVGTQADISSSIPGKRKPVTIIVREDELSYITEGF